MRVSVVRRKWLYPYHWLWISVRVWSQAQLWNSLARWVSGANFMNTNTCFRLEIVKLSSVQSDDGKIVCTLPSFWVDSVFILRVKMRMTNWNIGPILYYSNIIVGSSLTIISLSSTKLSLYVHLVYGHVYMYIQKCPCSSVDQCHLWPFPPPILSSRQRTFG